MGWAVVTRLAQPWKRTSTVGVACTCLCQWRPDCTRPVQQWCSRRFCNVIRHLVKINHSFDAFVHCDWICYRPMYFSKNRISKAVTLENVHRPSREKELEHFLITTNIDSNRNTENMKIAAESANLCRKICDMRTLLRCAKNAVICGNCI